MNEGLRPIVPISIGEAKTGSDVSAASRIDPTEVLRKLLYRAALSHKVDLGSWISIDAFLIGSGVAAEDLNRLTENDLDEVRRRLQAGPKLLERFDTMAEAIEESGFGPLGMAAAIGVSILAVSRLVGVAHAAASIDSGPDPSSLGGIIVSLVLPAIAVVFLTFATCGQAQPADEEAYDDTTGFGERER